MIPVFYKTEMNAQVRSTSPSAGKPRLVVEDWIKKKLAIDIKGFIAATIEDLKTVHRPSYVDGVFNGTKPNGFGTNHREVADSTLWTVGSMLAATDYVIANGGVACSPTSGFHHARYSSGGGFCTFNGLMVATKKAISRYGIERVGIVDCDWHFGDGTADIIETDPSFKDVAHMTIGGWQHVHAGAEYVYHIQKQLKRSFKKCELILYQAGADPHKDDPLGGVMTNRQLKERDTIVFEFCKEHGIPLVWNLAGGYQKDANGGIPKVLAIHRATMRECIKAFAS